MAWPQRIVSLAPSATETLFALGLGERLVGATSYCDSPPEARSLPRVGGYKGVRLDKVVAARPDLVLAGERVIQGEDIEALEKKGLRVLVLDPPDLPAVLENILKVGAVCGKLEAARGLVERLRLEMASIEEAASHLPRRARVYYEEWPQPPITTAPGNWVHDMILLAGGENIFADRQSPGAVVNFSEIAARDPEVVVISWCGAQGRVNANKITSRPGWQGMSALVQGRVTVVDDSLFTRPGPRLVEGLRLLAGLVRSAVASHVGAGTLPATLYSAWSDTSSTLIFTSKSVQSSREKMP